MGVLKFLKYKLPYIVCKFRRMESKQNVQVLHFSEDYRKYDGKVGKCQIDEKKLPDFFIASSYYQDVTPIELKYFVNNFGPVSAGITLSV